MLGIVTALVLLGPFSFTAPHAQLSLTLPADPAFCVILPEAKINPDGCVNESVETIAHKRKPLQSVKSNALVATASKGTLLVTVHDWVVPSRKSAADEVKRFFEKEAKREADEGRPLTWSSDKPFELESYNGVSTAHADAEHELPDGKWHEAHWLVLTARDTVEIVVQSSADDDVVAIGKTLMATIAVPEKSRVVLNNP